MTVYQNAYAIQVLAINGCSPQGTYGAIGPILVASSVNTNINAIPMTNTICLNSPMTFQDVSNPGSNVSSGSCDSLYGHYWTITPNIGYTLGAGATLGSSNGFIPNSQFGYDWQSWTQGSLQLPVTWTTPGTYQVTLFAGNDCGMDSTVYNISVNFPMVSGGANQSVCAGTAVTLNGSGASSYAWNNGVTNAVAFTPVSSQTYTLIGTDANGCTGSDTVVVSVLDNGASSLTQTALDSYTLNGQTYTQSGTYTQVVPAANGCDSTITLNLTLNFTGIHELGNSTKILVKITDLNGKIIQRRKNTVMLFIYEDGTVERVVEMD